MTQYLSGLAVPLLLAALAALILVRARRQRGLFDEFLGGAEEGVRLSVRLLPTLVALMTAVAMLRASGFPDLLAAWLAPVAGACGIPPELLPLVLLRPVSGSGSNAMIVDLFEQYGVDSRIGLSASVLLGSSDTLIYIIAVYFSTVKVRRTRHAIPAALLVALLCLFLSCAAVSLFFGGAYA